MESLRMGKKLNEIGSTLYQKVARKHCSRGISDYQHYHRMSTAKVMPYIHSNNENKIHQSWSSFFFRGWNQKYWHKSVLISLCAHAMPKKSGFYKNKHRPPFESVCSANFNKLIKIALSNWGNGPMSNEFFYDGSWTDAYQKKTFGDFY